MSAEPEKKTNSLKQKSLGIPYENNIFERKLRRY